MHQEEGSALDFKGEQYRFDRGNLGDKAELVKDILTFANSWRLTTAYILVGVKEVKASRNELVGVEHHLDDANLHQFVNSKTQRTVDFRYLPFRTENVEIGVIEIPRQERPIYLTTSYGNLRPNDVWIRDGSSSRIATSDEIARMGAERVLYGAPEFTLEWADIYSRKSLLSSQSLTSLFLDPPLPPDTFTPIASGFLASSLYNHNYSKEIIRCTVERSLLSPLGFMLQNQSALVGKRVRFTGEIYRIRGLVVQEGVEELPERGALLPPIRDFTSDRHDEEGAISLLEFSDRWEIEIDFGDVRPRDRVWTNGSLFFGARSSMQAVLKGQLKGDNIADPIDCELRISVEAENRPMTKDDVIPLMR